jgi:NADH-quinone oxidoreductase subunit M
MKVLLFLLIFQIFGSFVILSFKNKWFWKWCLSSNIVLHNVILYFFATFNKLYIGYQNIYSVNLSFISQNFLILFGYDGISLLLIWLSIFVITLCILISKNREFKKNEYLMLLLSIQLILVLVFSTLDLIFFFFFFEIGLLPVYLLILKWGPTTRRPLAGYYFFLYTFCGSILMVLGIWLIILETGTSSILVLESYTFENYKQVILWFLFFWSFAVKIPLFPFHIWLPEAHVEAPTEGSIILAALLLKLGSYGFIRILINFFPFANGYFLPLVSTLALISIFYSSFIAVIQKDFKKIIAYSSISHMGFLTLGIFSNNIYGLQGAMSLMLAHGLVSTGLFGTVGFLYDRYHTRQIEYYSGFVQCMPLFSFFFFILMLGNSGFPGTYNFISEFLLLLSFSQFNFIVLIFSSIGIFFSIVYSMLPYSRIIFGNIKDFIVEQKDVNLIEFNFLLIIVVYVIALGLFPHIFLDISYTSLKFYLVKNNDIC